MQDGPWRAALEESRPDWLFCRVWAAGAGAAVVPSLDVPVPQMVDQAAEIVKFFVSLPVVAEQVIEVPTIIVEEPIPQRALLRAPRLAEQLLCKGNVSCTSYSRTFYDTQMATANCVHPHAQLEHA